MTPDGGRSAWYASLEGHDVLLRLFDAELIAECGIGIDWYDVLVKLWLAPGRSLRMSELADQVLLSRSWLTRRVIQLEAAGLVTRGPAGETDRRGVSATLTTQGRRVFARLERAHARSVEAHFSHYLSEEEAAVVEAFFGRVATAGRAALAGRAQARARVTTWPSASRTPSEHVASTAPPPNCSL